MTAPQSTPELSREQIETPRTEETLPRHMRWVANKYQPDPDPYAYQDAAFNLRAGADEIERLSAALARKQEVIQELVRLKDLQLPTAESDCWIGAWAAARAEIEENGSD